MEQPKIAIDLRRFVRELDAATGTIAECEFEGWDAQAYVVSVLQNALAATAGISPTDPELNTHASCFDTQTTEAIRRLVHVLVEKA